MTFTDRFGPGAAGYRQHRPDYPPALYAYLAALVPGHELAWDCATGSGQAAAGLAAHFRRVVATDASAGQLAHAVAHERVEYRRAPAEASGLGDGAVDLVTVAQALHWFDLDAFYAEARRVLRPGGALAVWSYNDAVVDDPAADALVRQFNHDTLGPYWPSERALVRDGYATLPFPFAERAAPAFTIERRWTLGELAAYLRTWSATARYAAERGSDPVAPFERALAGVWGERDRPRLVRWPLTLRVGFPGDALGSGGHGDRRARGDA